MMCTKFRRPLTIALAVISICLFGGCATKAEKEPEKIQVASASAQAIREDFIQRVEAKDVDGLMALLTPDFTHNHFGDRESIHQILTEAVREGFLEGVTVDATKVTENQDADGLGMIGPFQVVGLFGHINFTLYYREIDKQWYVHKVIVDV